MKLQFKRLFSVVLCVLLTACAVFCGWHASAAQPFTMTKSDVSEGAFTVTVNFPAEEWGSFDFVLQFDPAVVQLSKKPTTATVDNDIYGFTPTRPDISTANTTDGKYYINGVYPMGENMANAGTKITFHFTVKDTSAQSTQISMTINEFVRPDDTDLDSAPASVTVTLKTVDSSTDSGSSESSTVTDTPSSSTATDSDTSNKTDGTPSDTDTSTKPNTSTKTDTATKTDSDAGTQSDTGTDSEALTDTESDGSDSDTASETEGTLTDGTDATDSDPFGGLSQSAGSLGSFTNSGTDQGNRKPVSTGMVALISLGISVVFCGVLTVVGLLRHKTEREL